MYKCNPQFDDECLSAKVWLGPTQRQEHDSGQQNRIAARVRKVRSCSLCLLARNILGNRIKHFGKRVHELPFYVLLFQQATSWLEARKIVEDFCGLSEIQHRKQWIRFIIQGGRDSLPGNLDFFITSGVAQRVVNTTDEFGETALIHAAFRSTPEVIGSLLDIPGIDVNSMDHSANTALSWAIHSSAEESTEIVRLLLAHPTIDLSKGSPLFCDQAANDGPWTAAIPSTQGNQSASPTTAVDVCRPLSVSALSGLQQSLADHVFQSDDSLKLSKHSRQAVRSLVRPHSVLSLHSTHEATHWYRAQRKWQWIRDVIPGNPAALACFIQSGSDHDVVNAQDAFGRTALMCAVLQDHWGNIKELLKISTINLNVISHYGETALSLAVQRNRILLVKYLLAYPDIDPNAGVPLVAAAYHNLAEMTELLLQDSRIDANVRDRDGHTPLSLAMFFRHHWIVQRLLVAPGIAQPERTAHF